MLMFNMISFKIFDCGKRPYPLWNTDATIISAWSLFILVGGNHYERMQYKNASVSSNNMPCTNVPIHCPLCLPSFSGNPQTIWKYNAVYHLISEHSNNGVIPEIPGELMLIHKTEEE